MQKKPFLLSGGTGNVNAKPVLYRHRAVSRARRAFLHPMRIDPSAVGYLLLSACTGARGVGMSDDCWNTCSGGGRCSSCGTTGACCRAGFDVADADCHFGVRGCSGHHCCIDISAADPPPPPLLPLPPPPPPPPPLLNEGAECWNECNGNGFCASFCGGGACCRAEHWNDPAECGYGSVGCASRHCCAAPLFDPPTLLPGVGTVGQSNVSHTGTTAAHCEDPYGAHPTIAFAFLTRSKLPMWHLWQAFFNTCAPGTALPIVHSMDSAGSAELSAELEHMLHYYGGHVLPPSETRVGDVRFEWRMLSVMFSLMRTATRSLGANGCRPRWVHFLSEKDVPIRTCPELQALLQANAGWSFLDQTHRGEHINGNPPSEYQPVKYTSQWMTLTIEAASTLAMAEAELHDKYGHLNHGMKLQWPNWAFTWGAVDEYMWNTELTRRHLPFRSPKGLTHVDWPRNSNGHPGQYDDHESALRACRSGRSMGYYFSRKYGDGSDSSYGEVMRAVAACTSIAMLPQPSPSPPSRPPPPLPPPSPVPAFPPSPHPPPSPSRPVQVGWSWLGVNRSSPSPPTLSPPPSPTTPRSQPFPPQPASSFGMSSSEQPVTIAILPMILLVGIMVSLTQMARRLRRTQASSSDRCASTTSSDDPGQPNCQQTTQLGRCTLTSTSSETLVDAAEEGRGSAAAGTGSPVQWAAGKSASRKTSKKLKKPSLRQPHRSLKFSRLNKDENPEIPVGVEPSQFYDDDLGSGAVEKQSREGGCYADRTS